MQTTLSPSEISESIRTAWERFLTRKHQRGPQDKPRTYVRASQWRACDRAMVYDLLAAPRAEWSVETLANFRRGNDREQNLMRDLQEIGRDCEPPFRVNEQQVTVSIHNRKKQPVIVGHSDGTLEFETLGRKFPLEIKSWGQNTVARIHEFADVLRSPWTRSGAYQLLVYLYGHSEPTGFFLLDRHGIPSLLPVELEPHLELVESFLARSERVVDAKLLYDATSDAKALPPFIEDSSECKRCPYFGGTCNPPLSNPGATILEDGELEATLARREELKPAAEEFDDLDVEVKGKLRGVEMGLVGNFLVEGKFQSLTTYQVPKEVRDPYKKVDPKGKFVLKITKV